LPSSRARRAQVAARFNWLYHDATTYAPYATEALHVPSLLLGCECAPRGARRAMCDVRLESASRQALFTATTCPDSLCTYAYEHTHMVVGAAPRCSPEQAHQRGCAAGDKHHTWPWATPDTCAAARRISQRARQRPRSPHQAASGAARAAREERQAAGAATVLRTLVPNARAIFRLLADFQLAEAEDGGATRHRPRPHTRPRRGCRWAPPAAVPSSASVSLLQAVVPRVWHLAKTRRSAPLRAAAPPGGARHAAP
jgi:hypothetical protein